MDIAITIDFWFLVSLCLAFILIGMILGTRSLRERQDRDRY